MNRNKKTHIGSRKTSCITTYHKITPTQQLPMKNSTIRNIISNINTKQHIITQH